MKITKLLLLGLILLVLILPSIACTDLIPSSKAKASTQSPSIDLSTGRHNASHYYRFHVSGGG